MSQTLAEKILDQVWDQLNQRRWFGKHVEDDAIDELYHDLGVVIEREVERADD
jgi:hypothetical protein